MLTLAGGVPTWAASAGGAGGLEIEVKDANFTAVDGKHYLCTENVTAVTLPAMTATAKIAFSPIRSADWGNTTMTLTPDGAETTEGDATFDADASSVDVMTFTADIANTNWEVLTTISPSAATAGGDVTGPGSSTDNAVARFDSTTGKLLQDSKFAVADNGDATLDNDSAQAQFSLDGQTTNGGKLNFKYGGTTSAYISSNNGGSNTGIYFGNQGSFDRFVISHGGSIHPAADNIYSCGTGSFRWTAVYATNGSINTSDERQKDNIEDLSLGLNFVNSLSPVSYTWKANPDYGTSWGFIAQDVAEKVPQDSSIATYDAEDDVWGLNYAQFTAVNTKAIQELSKMVEDLKKEMAELVKTNTHKE